MPTILTDEELVRHADLALSPLTSTDLERELLRRFEACLVGRASLDAPGNVLPAFHFKPESDAGVGALRAALQFAVDFDPQVYRPLLDALAGADIDTAAALTKRLNLADEFEAIANDAGDAIARLQDLITSTTT